MNNQVLIFSDIHISNHKNSLSRLDDCLKCLEWVFAVAKEKGIDTIVFAGDLFQDRNRINILAYQKTFEIFERYQEITLYLLIGNHDMLLSEQRNISSVIPFRALPKIKVIDRPCCINIKNKDIDFLPYTKNPKSDIDNFFKHKSEILLTHIAIDGACLNALYKTTSDISVEYDGDMIKVDVGIFDGWKKILSGHYHAAQKVGEKFEYVGSPLQLNFNEVFQKKHIIIMDLDTLACEYIENTFSPRHLIIQESDVSSYKLEGNFVQIISDNLNSSKIMDMKNNLSKVTSTLEFKESKNNKKTVLKTDLDKAKKILSEGEIIENYTSIIDTKLNKDKLITIGRNIIKGVLSN